MTPQQQRIALATWCGWTTNDLGHWKDPTKVEHYTLVPPDYLNDLNTVHELEERLKLPNGCMPSKWFIHMQACTNDCGIRATAAQRCEALLRTLNLWRDE